MPRLLPRLNRRRTALGAVLIGSAALLAAGLLGILSAVTGDPADLPQEGSLETILAENEGEGPRIRADSAAAPDSPAVQEPSGPRPVSIAIPRIYVEAPVKTMGVDDRGYPEVPGAPDVVAWYDFSAEPGQGSNAVFSGHFDWVNRWGDPIPAVFYRLKELEIGDTVEVRLEDGTTLTYRVTGNVAVPYDDPNVVKVMGPASKDVITLITCAGTWVRDPDSPLRGNYSHRIIVRAERVTEVVSAGPAEPD